MNITVYCDKEGILRYNPDGWPGRSEVEMSPDVLAIAKSQSIPFEDQDSVSKMMDIQIINRRSYWIKNYFYDVEIDGAIEIVELSKEEMAPGNRRIVSLVKVARIVNTELSGNSGQLQSSDPNSPNYIISTNVITVGMDRAWLELWEQIEIWSGDLTAKESGEELLIRLQKSFNLTKK